MFSNDYFLIKIHADLSVHTQACRSGRRREISKGRGSGKGIGKTQESQTGSDSGRGIGREMSPQRQDHEDNNGRHARPFKRPRMVGIEIYKDEDGFTTLNKIEKKGHVERAASYLVSTKTVRVQKFVNGLVARLCDAVAPQMKVLAYYEAVDFARKLEEKGGAERAVYDVHKKAMMGVSFSGDFSANHRAGFRENSRAIRQGHIRFTVCACKPPPRQGTQ
ncbi:hypothetical protein FXO37_31248 [Capsicum annuum]|nr:hypothetical protein FXO37_31248 [Capsicum annuum]